MRNLRARERGATSLEYGGMIAAAALVVALVFAAILQGNVAPQVQAAICRLFQQDCATSSEIAIDTLLPECEVTSTSFEGGAEITVFSVNLGGEGTMTLKKIVKPDGTVEWQVEQAGGVQIGAHVMFGEKGKFGLGEGLSAEAKAALTAAGGATFTFPSEAAAKKFMEESAKEIAKQAAAAQTGPLAPLTNWGLDQVTGGDFDYPPPTEYYIELGTEGSGELMAAAGLEAGVSGGGGSALGVKVQPGQNGESPTYTFYYKGTGELAGSLGIAGVGPSGEFEAETVVGVSFRDGEAISASIDTTGTVNSRFVSAPSTGDVPIGNLLGSGSIGVDVTATAKGKVVLQLDLTNTENREALSGVLNSAGMAILPGGLATTPDLVSAVGDLSDRFTQAGPRGGATLTSQQFEGSSGSFEVGFFAGDLVAFGAGGSVSTSQLNATNASYYDPEVDGMSRWRRCEGGS